MRSATWVIFRTPQVTLLRAALPDTYQKLSKRGTVAEFNDKGADVLASVILKFENGARAVFNVGMIFDPGSNRRKDILYVHGSKGTIVSDVEYNQEGKVSYNVTSGSKVYTPSINVPHNYMLEIEQLGRCIENGEAPHITPEFSIKNAELLDEILKQIGY